MEGRNVTPLPPLTRNEFQPLRREFPHVVASSVSAKAKGVSHCADACLVLPRNVRGMIRHKDMYIFAHCHFHRVVCP